MGLYWSILFLVLADFLKKCLTAERGNRFTALGFQNDGGFLLEIGIDGEGNEIVETLFTSHKIIILDI